MVDTGIVSCLQIRKFKLFHRLRCLLCWRWVETDVPLAMQIDFRNGIVLCFVRPPHSYPATDINVLFGQRMSLSEFRIWISDTNRIQGISISVDCGFAVVQRSAVLIRDGSDALVAGDKSLNCIGAFDGLYFGDGFQFSIGFRIFDFLNTGHCLNEAMAEARLTKFAGNSPRPKKD